ncbi:unnamed protein product [Anisakis simplex]|uniref:Uncharacterized protein n=1 Tax=Anisakis simplex TaxID=6269 RepID=A0A0M3JLN4_ANISI|nr:unnamed protein product [Anisakis simplex]
MANIINAENQRKSSMDSSTTIGDEKPVQQKSNVGKAPKSHRRLNNLDVDELTESDSEEYHASEESTEASDAISDDTDEYVPSDEARRLVGIWLWF